MIKKGFACIRNSLEGCWGRRALCVCVCSSQCLPDAVSTGAAQHPFPGKKAVFTQEGELRQEQRLRATCESPSCCTQAPVMLESVMGSFCMRADHCPGVLGHPTSCPVGPTAPRWGWGEHLKHNAEVREETCPTQACLVLSKCTLITES